MIWVLFVAIAGGHNSTVRLTTFKSADECWRQAAVVRQRVEAQLNYKTSTFCVPEYP